MTRYRSLNCNFVGTPQGRCSKAANEQSLSPMLILTLPLMVDMVCEAEKSLESPKSIIFTQVGSPLSSNMKFSGFISLHRSILKGACAYLCEMLFSWRYMSALRSCFIIMAASFSVKCLRSRIKWKSSPPLQYSNTKKQTSFHSQISCSFIM